MQFVMLNVENINVLTSDHFVISLLHCRSKWVFFRIAFLQWQPTPTLFGAGCAAQLRLQVALNPSHWAVKMVSV